MYGPMKSHGFARISVWDLVGVTSDLPSLSITATFRLSQNDLTAKMWGADKKFTYDYAVTLKATDGDSPSKLEIQSTITNTGADAFGFTMALHSYFPVSDISQSCVCSAAPYTLKGLKYVDSLMEGKERKDKICTQEKDEVIFDKEVDRIYLNVPKLLQVVDKKKGTAVVQQTDFKDSIVWNPWIEKGKRMAQKDYGEDEYKEMICVEVAEVGTEGNAIELKAGEVCKRTVVISSAKAV
mmetsp:Transcript_40343/g.78524  ORF Transcript_40343/g.78524 Transcript_40343/m.78524 type:complete len:239 (+) Transcript_40343:1-717(+)